MWSEYSYHPVFPDADPDMQLLPDYTKVSLAPWSSVPCAVAIRDCVELNGALCRFAPRSLLKNVLARYAVLERISRRLRHAGHCR